MSGIVIGGICKAVMPYYDRREQKMKFKSRPVLVIARADESDLVVLPVSSITIKRNISETFDIPINPELYPAAGLKKLSYCRTHKQTIVHASEIIGEYGDLKRNYPDLYLEILAKREEFSKLISEQSIE